MADLLQFNPTYEIATGPNQMNDRGIVRAISEIIPYPGGGWNNPSLPDVCILRLASPLFVIQPAVLGSVNVGDYFVGTGFGRSGSPATGPLPRDGNVRGVSAPNMGASTAPYNPKFFDDTLFSPNVLEALNGKPMSGDSDGGVFLLDGRLVGVWVAASTGTGAAGIGTYLRFDGPIAEWINATLQPCAPADINCDGGVNGADLGALLSAWGSPGATDIDRDGTTGGADLALVLSAWTG